MCVDCPRDAGAESHPLLDFPGVLHVRRAVGRERLVGGCDAFAAIQCANVPQSE